MGIIEIRKCDTIKFRAILKHWQMKWITYNVGEANFDLFCFSQIGNGNTVFCIILSRDRYSKDGVMEWVMGNLLCQLFIGR